MEGLIDRQNRSIDKKEMGEVRMGKQTSLLRDRADHVNYFTRYIVAAAGGNGWSVMMIEQKKQGEPPYRIHCDSI